MERQRHHFPLRPCFRLVEIHEVRPGARTISGGLTIVGRRRVRRDFVGDRLDAVRHARERSENFDQVRINPPGQGPVGGQQFFRRLVIKLRVGAEELEKLLSRSFEDDLVHDRLHLITDAFDFAQADLVDLRRAEPRGRVFAGEKGIHRVAVRQLPRADLLEARRQILTDEKVFQSAIRGDDIRGDSFAGGPGQPLAVCVRNRRCEILERLVKRALFGRRHDLVVNLPWDTLHDDFRLHDPFANALAHQRNCLVQIDRKRPQPRDPVLVVLHRLEAERVGQFVSGLNAFALIERREIPVIGMFLGGGLVVLLEQVIIELVLRRQLTAVNFFQARQNIAGVSVSLLDGGETRVLPAVVPATVAQLRCPGRILLHRVVPFGVEQGLKRFRGLVRRTVPRSHLKRNREQ